MNAIFADAFYWIALLNPQDAWYEIVNDYRPSLNLMTTDVVLDETLNFFSQKGSFMRLKAVSLYESIQIDLKSWSFQQRLRFAPQQKNSIKIGWIKAIV